MPWHRTRFNQNTITFDRSDAGAFGLVVADFDFA